MLTLKIIVTIFGALIFAMPILFPNAEVRWTNRGDTK